MSREKITVIIPTFNEEANIKECIESVRWADEVMVVDSFSTDKTLEIAKTFTLRILQHEYINSAAQKNWAIPQAAHPWVMIVDADERVSTELQDEILAVLSKPDGYAGFHLFRLNHFMGKPVRFCGWQRDDVLRVFRRDVGRYQERAVHADVEVVNGKVGVLKHKLYHNTIQSFDQYMKKFNRYTGWAATDREKVTKKVRWHHLMLRPVWRFFRQYVLYQGFRDGLVGVIICMMAAFSVFFKYARLWEIEGNQSKSHFGVR